MVCPRGLSKNDVKKKQLCNHFGVSSKNHIPIEICSKKQRKKQCFFNAKFHDIYQSLGARDVFGSRSKSPKWWPQVSYTWPWWPQKNQRTFVVCVLWWLRKNELSTVWWICCAQSSWQSWIKSFQFSVLRLDSWALYFAKFWTCSRYTGCICAAPFL